MKTLAASMIWSLPLLFVAPTTLGAQEAPSKGQVKKDFRYLQAAYKKRDTTLKLPPGLNGWNDKMPHKTFANAILWLQKAYGPEKKKLTEFQARYGPKDRDLNQKLQALFPNASSYNRYRQMPRYYDWYLRWGRWVERNKKSYAGSFVRLAKQWVQWARRTARSKGDSKEVGEAIEKAIRFTGYAVAYDPQNRDATKFLPLAKAAKEKLRAELKTGKERTQVGKDQEGLRKIRTWLPWGFRRKLSQVAFHEFEEVLKWIREEYDWLRGFEKRYGTSEKAIRKKLTEYYVSERVARDIVSSYNRIAYREAEFSSATFQTKCKELSGELVRRSGALFRHVETTLKRNPTSKDIPRQAKGAANLMSLALRFDPKSVERSKAAKEAKQKADRLIASIPHHLKRWIKENRLSARKFSGSRAEAKKLEQEALRVVKNNSRVFKIQGATTPIRAVVVSDWWVRKKNIIDQPIQYAVNIEIVWRMKTAKGDAQVWVREYWFSTRKYRGVTKDVPFLYQVDAPHSRQYDRGTSGYIMLEKHLPMD